jgi:hypothetical protein
MGLEKIWDTLWISGIHEKLWFIIMSQDNAYQRILRYFKQINDMNFRFLQIAPTNSLNDVPNYFVEWKWIFQVEHEQTIESIVNKNSFPASRYPPKTNAKRNLFLVFCLISLSKIKFFLICKRIHFLIYFNTGG